MASTLYADLSGAGTVLFGFAELTGYWHSKVTDLGASHAIELAGVVRYLDLGWLAPIETDPDSAKGMTGDFALGRTWLEFEKQTYDFKVMAADIAGFSGFIYNFRTGVVVDVTVGIP
jgi:hypothetical protein